MIRFKTTSLLVVDAQRGFTTLCPKELPVPGGLEIVPNFNRLLELPWARIDATLDWHPPDHCSFIGQRDNLYPPHCVIGTTGAKSLPGLHTERFHALWRKGFERDRDAYAVTAQHPGFVKLLKAEGIRHVVICGIATNICCYFTGQDLRYARFEVSIVEDACAGIDVPAAGLYQAKAKAAGQKLGIRYIQMADILPRVKGTSRRKRGEPRESEGGRA